MEPVQKTLLSELESMIQTFLAHEEKTLSEAPAEFHVLLGSTLRDIVSSIFLSEVQRIADIKAEIRQVSQNLEQKQGELNGKLSAFLSELTDVAKTQRLGPEFESLKNTLSQTIMEVSAAKGSLKRTARKAEGKQPFCETPRDRTAVFAKKPRAACVIFMEKRMGEVCPGGAGVEEYRGRLKGLMEEWKRLGEEERREFDGFAEAELLEYFQL